PAREGASPSGGAPVRVPVAVPVPAAASGLGADSETVPETVPVPVRGAVPETASAPGPVPVPEAAVEALAMDAGCRERVGVAQAALLSALVAGTPVPEGFDLGRVRVQARALAAKRADVIGKVAPELPVILGSGYRDAFLGYARTRPMAAGYRRDALDFAEYLLVNGLPHEPAGRLELTHWWQDRTGPKPPGRIRRMRRRARSLVGRWTP
ncbi:hypothetical protein ACM614_06155, partial [Streptomyces sp. 12297]